MVRGATVTYFFLKMRYCFPLEEEDTAIISEGNVTENEPG